MPPQWLRANVVYQPPQNDAFINVLYFKPAATETLDQDYADLAAAQLESAIHGHLKAVITSASEFLGVSISLHDGNLVWDATSNAHVGNGTIGGDEEPDYVAAVIQKRTATGGRSGRGRWFLGCVPESFTDENRLTAGAAADYLTIASDFWSEITLAGGLWAGQLHSTKLNTLLPIVSAKVDLYLGRQSRRRVRPAL